MKTLKNTITIILASYLIFIFIGCKAGNEKDRVVISKKQTTTSIQTKDSKSTMVGSVVPTDEVCMVNDAYMGKLQIPVPVNGKTYYGCCKMCVKTLNENKLSRTAVDPYNNKRIDKSEAFIVLVDESGKVAYFESEDNFKKYNDNRSTNY